MYINLLTCIHSLYQVRVNALTLSKISASASSASSSNLGFAVAPKALIISSSETGRHWLYIYIYQYMWRTDDGGTGGKYGLLMLLERCTYTETLSVKNLSHGVNKVCVEDRGSFAIWLCTYVLLIPMKIINKIASAYALERFCRGRSIDCLELLGSRNGGLSTISWYESCPKGQRHAHGLWTTPDSVHRLPCSHRAGRAGGCGIPRPKPRIQVHRTRILRITIADST
jgi:hypothetical protein